VAGLTGQSIYTAKGDVSDVRYAHVEISFPTNINGVRFANNESMGVSITQNSCVYMRLKSWRKEYHARQLQVETPIYNGLFRECARLAGMDIKFDRVGMYAGGVMPASVMGVRTRESHGTFCSKIIVEVLQQFRVGGMHMQQLIPCTSNPNSMYMALL